MRKSVSKKILFIRILLLIFILLGTFCVSYIIDTKSFYSKHEKYSDKYVLKVTYLLINKKNVHDGLTFDNIYKEGHDDVTMASSNTDIPLYKKGNFLYADLSKYANEIMFSKQVDYAFAEYNFNGIRIEDCSYDKKTKMIKIPYSYYKNKKQDIPIQFELVSAVNKKELKKLNIDVKTKNVYTKNTTKKIDNTIGRVVFKVDAKFKVKTANDIEIYINDNKEPLPEELFAYNTKTNTVGLIISPLLVNKVDIRIKNDALSLLAAVEPENRISITRNGRTMSNIGVGASVDPSTSAMNALDLGTNVPTFTSSQVGTKLYSVTIGGSNYRYCNQTYPCTATGPSVTVTDAHGNTGLLRRNSTYQEDVSSSENYYKYSYVGTGSTYYSPFYKSEGNIWADFLFPYALWLPAFSSGSYNLTMPGIWAAMPCVHNTTASSTNTDLLMDVELSKLGTNYAVLHLHTSDSRTAPFNQAIDSYIKVRWTPKGKIEVQKRIHGQEYNDLSGFNVRLYSNNTCTTQIDSKNSNQYGIVTFEGLTVGTTYYIKEVGHDTSAWQNDGCVGVTVPSTPNSSGNYIGKKTYYNTRKPAKGMVEVYKYKDSNNKEPIEGVQIQLFNSSGTLVATKTTSRLGLATFTGLAAGTYTIKEYQTVNGYALNTDTYSATITLNANDAFYYKGAYAGYGYNDTYYNNTYEAIKNYYNTEGKYFSYKHFIDHGLQEKRIGSRNFKVDEYMANKGGLEAYWEANKTSLQATYGNIYNWAFWHYITHIDTEEIPGRAMSYYKGLNEGTTGNNSPVVTILMPNKVAYGMIEVFKYDASTSAHTPLANAKITVTGNGITRNLTTNSNGYAKTNGLPAGTYTVKESEKLPGYVLNTKTYTVKINLSGNRVFSRKGTYYGYSFDAIEYRAHANTDVQNMTNIAAITHYINHGTTDGEQNNNNYTLRRGANNFSAHEYLLNYPDLVTYWNNNTSIHSSYDNKIYLWASYHYSQHGVSGSEARMGRTMDYYQGLPEFRPNSVTSSNPSEDNNSVTVMVPIPNEPESNYGAIKIKKILKNKTESKVVDATEYSRFTYDVYDSTNTKVTTLTLSDSGEACYGFTDNNNCSGAMLLTEGSSYTIKENINNSSSISPYLWSNTSGDVSVVIVDNETAEANFTNVENYYWCSVQKKDTETNQFIGGVSFDLYDTREAPYEKIATGTTGNIGIANGVSSDLLNINSCIPSNVNEQRGTVVFTMLPDNSNVYKVKETSENGYTGVTNNGNYYNYWNNLSDNYSSALSCKEMNYDEITNKYSCNGVSTNTVNDTKQRFCIKVKKIDGSTEQPLEGVQLVATNSSDSSKVFNATTDNEGYAVFDLGYSDTRGEGDYIVTEATNGELPGYQHWGGSITVTPYTLAIGDTTVDKTTCDELSETIPNYKYLLNWYKITEKNNNAQAEFKVKNSSNVSITHPSTKVTITDSNGVTKSCYQYSTNTGSGFSDKFVSTNGQVCIVGVPDSSSSYTITETNPAKSHTLDENNTKDIYANINFQTKGNDNTFKNYPTEFEFTKEITGNYGINPDRSTVISQLQKLRFNIKDNDNNVLRFVFIDGVYEYYDNETDPFTGTIVTDLQLQTEISGAYKMKLNVKHLPVGTYTIEEIDEGCTTSLGNVCNGSGSYLPSPVSFNISKDYNNKITATMTNIMTELTFTKNDLYSYEDPSDKVKFENNEEIKAFDDITFKIKDENGNYLNVTKLGDVGSCSTTSGYSEYFYNPSSEGDGVSGTELHTCGGNIKIENLCRDKTYTIEEVSVPTGSVFIKPNTNPTISKKISKTGDLSTNISNKVTISDNPTRIVFIKKDSRFNNDIVNDQNAEFEVYRCYKGQTTCTTTTAAEKMHFVDKATVSGEIAYKAISSSDLASGNNGVTTLKLNNDGKIIIRYLPADYSYILHEKKAPKGFYQMTEGLGDFNFIISNTSTGYINYVTNYPTSIKLVKEDIYRYYSKTDINASDTSTKEFDKIKFRLYDSSGNLVQVKKVQNGEYRYYNDDGTHNGTITDLTTLNGEFTISHLDRNTNYYIEEYNTDGTKEFILPNNINNSSLPGSLKTNKHPIVTYNLGNDTSTANPQAVSQMIENKPTRVVFKKVDINTNNVVSDSNKIATFNVYQCPIGTTCKESNGTLIYFEDSVVINSDVEDVIDGVARKAYKYSKGNESSGKVSNLKLDQGYLVLRYLPVDYNYVLVETSAPEGYYNPTTTEKYTEFSVLSTTLENGETFALPNNVNNTPIEITFTKDDFYRYMDINDKVKFENESEVKAFDQINFVLKNSQGATLQLCKVADQTVDGKTINVYQYLNSTCTNKVTNINTQNGKLKITNLYRATTYKIEEVSVPLHSVFALPSPNTNVTYTITTEGNTTTNNSNKKVVNNIPTKVLIYKKDDRTNNNIKESTNVAQFELYRCSNTSVNCKKNDTNEKVTFMKKAVLTTGNIQNDNNITDPDIGREAYRFVSTSDLNSMSASDKTNLTTTTLELDNNGQILLKYLPSNYKYVLVEKNAPDGYYNYVAGSSNNEVSIDVSNNTSGTVYNFVDAHTKITFNKNDLYHYYASSDLDKASSNLKIFDSMTFVLRDENGSIVNLTKVQDGEYRYIGTDGTTTNNNITELHTKNGSFVVTHLLRNKTYYIEETKSDTEGNFILPNNINNTSLVESKAGSLKNNKHPIVKYNIPNIIPNNNQITSLTQLIENKPSRVVFEKRDSVSGELVTEESLLFNVYQCNKTVEHCTRNNGVLINFDERGYNQDLISDVSVITQPIYVYNYNKLNSAGLTDLHTDRGVLVLGYLPSGYKYVLYEKNVPEGYYVPSESERETEFEVKETTLETGETYESLTSRISNEPTSIFFIKNDIYEYYDENDISRLNQNIKVFDTMRFILRDKNGVILRLKKTNDGIYRYLPNNSGNNITELQTYNGRLAITHLVKGETYYIEEVKSDDEGIFILPNYLTYDYVLPFNHKGHPVVKYELPTEKPANNESVTKEINNTPTRVVFEKRDSKYGNLIVDETTTFKIYQCNNTVNHCNEENGTLINFENRSIVDIGEDYGKEAYRYKKNNSSGVTDLHPYKGELIIRYLPSNYKYVLVETVSPINYTKPNGENARTEFTISNQKVEVEEVDVVNKPTSLLIRKYNDEGELLPDTEFRLFEVNNYDSTKPLIEQDKTLLKLKTIRDGVYESREIRDSDIIKTCKDTEYQKCSDISATLTYQDYVDTWANFEENSINQDRERIEIKEGEALIEYLEYGKYYIVEETKPPKGYSLHEKLEDRLYLVYIDELVDVLDTEKEFVNKPVPFTFYKYDEYNKLIDGAKFKLQKLNNDKKYEDVFVTKELKDDRVYYKIDKNSENVIIETLNGSATIYYLEEGQYRVIEIEPPEGKELPKKTVNVVTFFVDKYGNVYGNSIIVNKSRSETTKVNPTSQAELIVNISTGQTVVKYGLMIAVVLGALVGLMYIGRRKK